MKFFYFLFLLVLLSACEKAEKKATSPSYGDQSSISKKTILPFGVHPLHNPQKLFEVYQPLVDYINKAYEKENANEFNKLRKFFFQIQENLIAEILK